MFKPSSDAPLSGVRLVEAFAAGGIPAGVLNLITGPAEEVGPDITAAPAIRAISFTGSTAAGEQIHRSVPFTTRLQLELGGKNPLIVMEDADLDKAVDLTIKGGLSLTGQAWTGTSRGSWNATETGPATLTSARWRPRGSCRRSCATSRSARVKRASSMAANASAAPATTAASSSHRRSSPMSPRRCASRARKSSDR